MGTTARTAGVSRRCVRRGPIVAIFIASALIEGCVPVGGIPNDGTTPPPADGGGGPATFAVSILVSNPTPQLNEEVTFRCTIEDAVPEPLTFSFRSPDVVLQVDSSNATASFVVSESDVGLTFDVTCRASDAEGRTAESARITVAPTE